MDSPDPSQPTKRRGPPSSLTPTREAWLRRLVAEQPQATPKELAQAMGNIVVWQTVERRCKKLGLPYASNHRRRMKLTPETEKLLRSVVAQLPSANINELAHAMGNVMSAVTIRAWCRKLGLSYRRGNSGTSILTPEIEDRLRAVIAERPSAYITELTQAMGNIVCSATIGVWCRKLGRPRRQKRGPPPEVEARLRELLRSQPAPYYREITQAIGKHVDRRTIKAWCVKLGLPYKPLVGLRSTMTPEIDRRLRTLVGERPSASYQELAQALRVHVQTVAGWIKRLGLPHPPCRGKMTPEAEDRLRVLLVADSKARYAELARTLQVSVPTVRGCIKRLGLPHEGCQRRMTPELESQLRSLVAEKSLAMYRELADTLHVHISSVMRWIKCLQLSHPPCHRELTPELESRLRALVAEKPLASYRELSGALEVPTATVMRWVKHLGLPHQYVPYRGSVGKRTPERLAQLRTLVAERPSAAYQELAEALHVNKRTVQEWTKRLELPFHGAATRKMTSGKEAEFRQLVAERPLASFKELAGVLKLSTTTIQRWARRLGLPHLEYVQKMTLEKQAQLRSLVAENPLVNYQELSRALRIPSSTIHYWVGRLKIPAPYRGFKGKITPEKDALLRSLVAKNPAPTYQELAEALCIDKATVFKWVKRLGIPLHGHRRKITPDNEERLRRLVTERPQANFRELARVMQLSPTIIQHWVKRLALPHHDGRK